MYNRYISGQGQGQGHVPIDPPPQPEPTRKSGGGLLSGLLGRLGAGLGTGAGTGDGNQISQALSGLLKSLHLEHLDTGDILLGLIVLFLVLEDGDDLDLLITLGLTILLSLGEP